MERGAPAEQAKTGARAHETYDTDSTREAAYDRHDTDDKPERVRMKDMKKEGKKARVGIIGAAHHHLASYLAALQGIPAAEVVGIVEEDAALAKKYTDEYALTRYSRCEELFAEGVDAVIICSTTADHKEHARQAAAAGAHILCEKPLATTLSAAEEMARAAADARVRLMPALPMRFSNVIVEARQAIAAGGIGDLRGGSATNQGQMPYQQGRWFIDPLLAGGGALMDHTIHVTDLLRWLTNSEVTRVTAFCNKIAQPIATEVESGALVILHLRDGIAFSLDASWSRPPHYPTWGGLTLRIVGTKGIIEIDAFNQNNIFYGERAQHTRYQFWGDDANSAMIAHFITAVAEGSDTLLTAEDALAGQRIIAAAYRSAAEGAIVEV